MASEQAKASVARSIAEGILDIIRERGIADPEGELGPIIADRILSEFAPPCPDCGAAVKQCIKWLCGSWDEGGAHQTSVKCVKGAMQTKIDELEKQVDAALKVVPDALTPPIKPAKPTVRPGPIKLAEPIDPHDGAAVVALSDAAARVTGQAKISAELPAPDTVAEAEAAGAAANLAEATEHKPPDAMR